jgi:hypothetical protein
MSEEPQVPSVPYASFAAVKNFLEGLAKMDGAVPDHVDRSILRTMSGSNQAALLMALRFLELIENDDDGTVKPALGVLVGAKRKGDPEWRAALRSTVEKAYGSVVGPLKVATATPEKVEEAFKAKKVRGGEMLEKSVRFYLKACEEAGIPISPLLKARKPPTKVPKPKEKVAHPKVSTGEVPQDDQPDDKEPLQSGFERLPIPGRPGAYIRYPTDLTETDCKLFEAHLVTLRVLLAALNEKKGASQ